METLLCSVPDGPLERTSRSLLPWGNDRQVPIEPVGILRISSYLEKNGYDTDIYDINNLRPTDEELIENFKRVKPTVVGLSGTLSHCYPNVKRISKILRKLFPDIWIILGGHLTGSSNVILEKTETDICVIGDGEIPFLKLLEYFKLHPTRRQLDYTGLHQIKGLAFTDENNKFRVTGNAEQLPASEMQYRNFDKLETALRKFNGNGVSVHEYFDTINNLSNIKEGFLQGQLYPEGLRFYKKNKNKKIGSIMTVRG
ncbi:MAG: cobalamin B12-binding domain-containing protein, partial [SAR202 cluster bacterium]|nr:cobalamin B12-binding domain-containing protein [SAR202 cluster bacterium]